MFAAVAKAWQEKGSVAAAKAAASVGLSITAAQLDTLAAAITKTNDTRKARLLEPIQILDAIATALRDPHGIGIIHGGEANDGTQRTTLCLAYVANGALTVGVGLSRARGAGPGVTWSELQPWSRTAPEKNVPRLRTWAGRRAKDRVQLQVATKPTTKSTLTDQDALLAAVLHDPDDDAARTVYADRLLAAGDPRGEFIAIQLALETARAGSAKHAELASASAALLKQHGARWSQDVAQFTLKQRYRRGFIYEVAMRARAFLSDGERLFELAPIESVSLRGVDAGTIAKLAVSPLLAKVRALRFEGTVGNAGAKLLAAGGQLRDVRALDVLGCGIDATALVALINVAPKLTRVTVNLTERVAEVLLPIRRITVATWNKSRGTKGSAIAKLDAAGRVVSTRDEPRA